MKKTYFISLLLIMVLITPYRIIAADTSQTLTLRQAIEMALKFDLQLRTAANDLEKSNLAMKQEVIKVFPQATVQGAYQYDLTSDSYPSNYSITISETIPTKGNLYGQKVVSNIDAAVWDQVYNQAQYQITKANVVYNTTQKYLTVLKDLQILQLQEKAVQNAQAAFNLATEQLKYGKITKTTQLKTENDLNNADLLLEQNRANYEISLQQLANQIGQTDLTNIALVEDQSIKMEAINAEQLRAQALKDRLEIQQSQITIRKAERSLAQAANQGLPSLSLNYNNIGDTQSCTVGYDFLSGDINWSGAQRQVNRPIDPYNNSDNHFGSSDINYTLKLTWNLDFGIAANQTKQAKLTLENAKLTRQQTIQNIRLDIQQAVSDYQLAVKKTITNQKLIPYYQKDLDIKILQNQLGTATQLDVQTAQLNLSQARIEAVKADYDQLIAYQKLQLAAGGLYNFDQKP